MSAGGERVGLLVMAHGTPGRPEDVESFYTRIRRGSPPSAEQLDDLVRRYQAIGGISPLAERTRRQVDALAGALHEAEPGRWLVRYGAKHTDPSIEEAAAELAAAGVDRVVGLVLTPHQSGRGSGEYLARAAGALAGTGTELAAVDHWYDAPGFADLMADRVLAALDELAGAVDTEAPAGHRAVVVFSAHSVPARAVEEGDPYQDQVRDSASLVAETAEIDDWQVAFQSAGRTPEPWLGPDLNEALRRLAADGVEGVVVCPIGFVSDHLEVLYDIDVESRAVATEAGLAFARTASLNDDPRFVAVLAGVARAAAGPAR